MSGPLSGIRVIDVCAMLSGPWAADILGDQGADVVKVEVPGVGEHCRHMSPYQNDVSAWLIAINRSKRSFTLNLKDPKGLEVFKELVKTADVLIQNFRPGVAERMGLGYEALKEVKPDLVYLSISGFGEEGPLVGQRVYDPIIQAMTGLTTIQGGADDERPKLIRTVLPDKLTAIVGSQAITAALYARSRTGEGQHIKLSMLDAVLSFVFASDMGDYTFVDQPVEEKTGGASVDLIYDTQDGYITAGVNTNAEWVALCKALNKPEWLQDERFKTPAGRSKHIKERLAMTQEVLLTNTREHWLKVFDEFEVPAAPALKRSELISHPQVLASGIVQEYDHPVAGKVRQARVPARFGGTPVDPPRGAPMLGEHNTEILTELGFSAEAVKELADAGVIGTEALD